jgi:hypothetical protein
MILFLDEICTKYLLILSEMNKKRVFWDGRRPVFSTIAKIAEAQMLTTIDTFLRKYLVGYKRICVSLYLLDFFKSP